MDLKSINKGKLIHGDCLEAMQSIPDDSIDLVSTDPPYGLKIQNQKWDKTQTELAIWIQIVRILKPGGFAFVMSSPRQDLMSGQINLLQQAGFIINFMSLYWVYSRRNVAKGKNIGAELAGLPGLEKLDGAFSGFQPKPVTEVILIAMKPLAEKSYTDQAIANGKGVTFLKDCHIPFKNRHSMIEKKFMSNIIVSDNAFDQFENECGDIELADNKGNSFRFSLDSWAKHTLPYLMVQKPIKKETEFGLSELDHQEILSPHLGQKSFDDHGKIIPRLRKNIHPTVKPIELMAYLTVLGSRPGDIIRV